MVYHSDNGICFDSFASVGQAIGYRYRRANGAGDLFVFSLLSFCCHGKRHCSDDNGQLSNAVKSIGISLLQGTAWGTDRTFLRFSRV